MGLRGSAVHMGMQPGHGAAAWAWGCSLALHHTRRPRVLHGAAALERTVLVRGGAAPLEGRHGRRLPPVRGARPPGIVAYRVGPVRAHLAGAVGVRPLVRPLVVTGEHLLEEVLLAGGRHLALALSQQSVQPPVLLLQRGVRARVRTLHALHGMDAARALHMHGTGTAQARHMHGTGTAHARHMHGTGMAHARHTHCVCIACAGTARGRATRRHAGGGRAAPG